MSSYTPLGKSEWGNFALQVGLHAIAFYAVYSIWLWSLLGFLPCSLSIEEVGSSSNSRLRCWCYGKLGLCDLPWSWCLDWWENRKYWEQEASCSSSFPRDCTHGNNEVMKWGVVVWRSGHNGVVDPFMVEWRICFIYGICVCWWSIPSMEYVYRVL